MKYFNLDGSEFIEDGHALAPIGLLPEDTVGYCKGWYFFDEIQEQHGPFESLEEAAKLFREYGNSL